jgi:steroid delta-isomerase-like uncharacterized protein
MGQARDTAQRFYELYGKGDLESAQELFSPDCVTEAPTGSMKLDEWRAYGQTFKDALPDARMEVDSAIESGNRVAVEARFVGTHEGPLATPQGTLPPSGKTINVPFGDFFTVVDGVIVEHHIYWDLMSMMAQLGAPS